MPELVRRPATGPVSWRDKAACMNVDPELFFPVGLSTPAALQTERAKKVCADCPVTQACLDWALAVEVDHGVWGGLSEMERRSLKRRRARARLRTG